MQRGQYILHTVSDTRHSPFFESCDTLAQISPGLKLRVLDGNNVDLRESFGESGLEILGKPVKRVIISLEAVDEDK